MICKGPLHKQIIPFVSSMTGYQNSNKENQIRQDHNLLIIPTIINGWRLSSKHTALFSQIIIDLIHDTFIVEFTKYPEEIPISTINVFVPKYNYGANFLSFTIDNYCPYHKYGFTIDVILDKKSNKIYNSIIRSEYLSNEFDLMFLHKEQRLLVTTLQRDSMYHLVNFTTPLNDPDLIDIIKASLILS